MPKITFNSMVRRKIYHMIDDHVTRKHQFLANPGRDFTRKRKLTLNTVLKASLLVGSGSMNKEILDYFDYSTDSVSGSVFTQQRHKLTSSIFKSIFKEFTFGFNHYKTYLGYRIVAVDGSELQYSAQSYGC